MNKSMKHLLIVLIVLTLVAGISVMVSAQVRLFPSPLDAGGFGGNDDFNFDPGGNDGGGFSGGDGFFGIPIVSGGTGGTVFIIIIVLIFLFLKSRGGHRGSVTPAVRQITPEQSAAVADQVRQVDPFFTEAEMREKVANLYTEMQRAWENQDWEPMRARMTDDLFSQMARQLQELISRGYINRIERIAVMNVALKQFYQDDQNDNLSLRLTTRIVDYTIDRNTGGVVSGDPKREKFMTYDWTMIRSKGVQTAAPDESGKSEISRNCPHCGAPIDLTQSARCAYCHSIVSAPEFDWVLSNIAGVAQQTL
ncbi:MAG TPA: TIM44-like domain-containing protein [Bacillota bacterium]|nr:TIM44-like domain-containing protein [Bacillota bacterium]